MLTVDQARARILADVPRMPAESASLPDAYGRFLFEDLHAGVLVPPHDNSGMDGYAVRTDDLRDATSDRPVALRLIETIPAGAWPACRVTAGTASAIMTGAPVPDGADAIVMVEDTDGARSGEVRVRVPARARQHIRPAGDDIPLGARVIAAGTRLSPVHVGVASSLGVAALRVARRPRIALLATGDEVIPPPADLRPGQIYASNSASLAGCIIEAGGVPLDLGVAGDRLDETQAALARCVAMRPDAIVTTGGVSMGFFDVVKEAFGAGGGEIDFWKVKMKPGKPLAFGRVGDVPLFGLPGNPVSCVVNFLQFVRPWVRLSLGSPRPYLPVIDAVAGEDLREKPGRFSFARVRLAWDRGAVVATAAGNPSSGALWPLSSAHGFALFDADSAGAKAGDRIRVQVFSPEFGDAETPGFAG